MDSDEGTPPAKKVVWRLSASGELEAVPVSEPAKAQESTPSRRPPRPPDDEEEPYEDAVHRFLYGNDTGTSRSNG